MRHFCGVLLDDETAEQENHPDRDSGSVEEKKDWKGKSGKGFKRMVADY